MSLVTCSNCGEKDQSTIDLSNFRSLKKISWIGAEIYSDVLRMALMENARHLTNLRLEFSQYPIEGCESPIWSPNFFAREILNLSAYLPRERAQGMFPALTSLCLETIFLRETTVPLALVLNVFSLTHLTLRWCPGVHELLEEVLIENQPLKLTTLEWCNVEHGTRSLQIFREIFKLTKNLKDLFLTLPMPAVETIEIWHEMAQNLPTLERFVYETSTISVVGDGEFEQHDILQIFEFAQLKMDKEDHPFSRMNLRCLGIGTSPTNVVSRNCIATLFALSNKQ